ncbi:MAG: 2Fe-2S iron-sulfur cluster-binding protein [Shimia sp.]
MKLFSDRRRPVHLGRFPLEGVVRGPMPDLAAIPHPAPVGFVRPEDPDNIVNAMAEHMATLDAIRDGLVNHAIAEAPTALAERARHLKAFAHFSDAAMCGCGPLRREALLADPISNPGIPVLAEALRTRQTKTLAAGIDAIMADLREALDAPPSRVDGHSHVLVILQDMPRDPDPDEPGAAWLHDAQAQRACLRAAETAIVIATYLRVLGHDAKAHTGSASDICLNRAAVAAGLIDADLRNPFLGRRYGLAAVTTTFAMAHDAPLARGARPPAAWRTGTHGGATARSRDPYRTRPFHMGPHPFETLRRVDDPTTYIDAPNVPRVPKRADLFARAQFGDMGPRVQAAATAGRYVRKAAPSAAQRRALGAFLPLQDGTPAPEARAPRDVSRAIKAAAYFLGADAVGLSACPDWTWYSHDATGAAIAPPHGHAISVIVDQGHETTEGSSGDDWISVAQSMRAYLRFSLIGGVLAAQLRRLGHGAKAHTVLDGEVLQPPLLLLAGLGEVSRIGEVILNPFLGPRLKSGVVTTTLPLEADRPIDFGLQAFCEACNKCARECPSGAITAGPKRMFNGYEIWKSDSQKCATYRMTTPGGAMCGRCMKTCPWNLEGLFAEAPFRWAAMHVPSAAPALARLDDAVGRGGLNPVKRWWWDLELTDAGGYAPTRHPVNARGIDPRLRVRAEDQTLAVYPAPLAAHPWPYPDPMDREAGIAAHRDMLGADAYRAARAAGRTGPWDHRPRASGDSPVLRLEVAGLRAFPGGITEYTLRDPSGADLPPWAPGAHIDLVVAPEFLRPYSLSGDPADRAAYRIGVLREAAGRGGSALLHRIFGEGRRVFASHPANHFPLREDAPFSLLFGAGIGITPLIAMAHRLHARGRPFRLHYAIASRGRAGFLDDLAGAPWAGAVQLHVGDEGTRADIPALIGAPPRGTEVYACGPDRFMAAVTRAAAAVGIEARVEHFAAPAAAPRPAHPFAIRVAGRDVAVPPDVSAAEALAEAGLAVPVKCSDGICGVCKCRVVAGEVDHRDHVLSWAERATHMILCRSRAAHVGGIVEIALD